MTDVVDGIFLPYTFSVEATNILYEGVPSYHLILAITRRFVCHLFFVEGDFSQ